MSEEDTFHCQAGNQLRQVLYKDIVRYAHESYMTGFKVIGVLESLKFDILNAMQDRQKEGDENEDEI